MRTAMGFDGKPFKSVAQGSADLDLIKKKDDAKDGTKPDEPQIMALIVGFKQVLGARVSDVRVSKRLTESACCIVNDGQMERTLEKLLSRQKDSGVSISAPVLEINPGNGLIKALATSFKDKGATAIEDAAFLLLDQAFMLEGEIVADPAAFAKRLDAMMQKAFS